MVYQLCKYYNAFFESNLTKRILLQLNYAVNVKYQISQFYIANVLPYYLSLTSRKGYFLTAKEVFSIKTHALQNAQFSLVVVRLMPIETKKSVSEISLNEKYLVEDHGESLR